MGWFHRFRQFLVEVWAELQKTTWPGLQEVRGTTVVVIVTVLICALYLYIVDRVLQTGLDYIFQMAGR